jgi:hypothetical protein
MGHRPDRHRGIRPAIQVTSKMPGPGATTWTCIVCGEVHPIDHAGGMTPRGMSCQGGCMAKAAADEIELRKSPNYRAWVQRQIYGRARGRTRTARRTR